MISRMEAHKAMAVKSIWAYKANTAIHYHNVPQKITFCSHWNWDFVNLVLTYRNVFCSREHFLFPLTIFVPTDIFSTWFHAKKKKNNNNNTASFRTFERCSRSKSIIMPNVFSSLQDTILRHTGSYYGLLPLHWLDYHWLRPTPNWVLGRSAERLHIWSIALPKWWLCVFQ